MEKQIKLIQANISAIAAEAAEIDQVRAIMADALIVLDGLRSEIADRLHTTGLMLAELAEEATPQKFLSPEQTSRLLGMTADRVRRLCQAGQFKGAVSIQSRWLIPDPPIRTTRRRKGPGAPLKGLPDENPIGVKE